MPPVTFALWFLLVWGAGWFFFPLARHFFGGVLPDGGLALGRVLFFTLWTWIAFWAGYAGLPVRLSAWLWLPLAALGLLFWKRDKAAISTEIRAQKRAMWTGEAIFLLVFLGFFALRGFWSDTSNTNGEKSMDNALISSLARANYLPPANPYAAGARLNSYYYFGHLQSALLTDAIGSHPRWTYNLMCATLPALCFSTLFSIGAALTKRIRGGVFCAASVLGLGTLQPLYQWLRPEEFRADTPFHLKFFEVSRVIPFSINEFPFFTFNQADLHAHYFGLPLALASIGASYSLFCGKRAAIYPAIAILGAQITTNTWDFPAYALLFSLAICAGVKRQTEANLAPEDSSSPKSRAALPALPGSSAARLVMGIGGALLLAAPYLLHIKTAAGPPKPLPFPASPMREWMLLWGVFAASWLAFLAYSVSDSRRYRAFCLGVAAIFLLYALAVPWKRSDPFVLPLILILLGFSIWGASRLQKEARFLCFLAIAGLCALLWSETTWAGFLGDPKHLGLDDNKRQDTVFKFGLQCWILWGVAASCGVVLTLRKWSYPLQIMFLPALPILVMASIAPVFGRTRNFGQWDGWDGWAHLAPGEKRAASWLEENVAPGDNLLEAEQREGGDYSPYSRYASATGIPSIIGPQAHTFQWSPANSGDAGREWEEVFRRKARSRDIYTSTDNARRADWLRSFGVKTVVFGELEREQYGPSALAILQSDPNLTSVAQFEDAGAASGNAPNGTAASDSAAQHRVQIFRVK